MERPLPVEIGDDKRPEFVGVVGDDRRHKDVDPIRDVRFDNGLVDESLPNPSPIRCRQPVHPLPPKSATIFSALSRFTACGRWE